jgi:Flp pilus assembly protein TadG
MQNSALTVVPREMVGAWGGVKRPKAAFVAGRRRAPSAWRGFGRCRKAAAAVEFALVSGPFLLMMFGFVATNALFYCWSVMQNNVQYAAMMMAAGQVTSWSGSNVSCSSSLTAAQVEYYACAGLPGWTTYTVRASQTCPSVSVTLTTNASTAGLADIYSLFSGVTLSASATQLKQRSCP